MPGLPGGRKAGGCCGCMGCMPGAAAAGASRSHLSRQTQLAGMVTPSCGPVRLATVCPPAAHITPTSWHRSMRPHFTDMQPQQQSQLPCYS